MNNYQKAYQALNTAQRQAVNELNGPVLVIAGPGTGKTQLISARVANILQKTDSSAENILCLTFTNKAATNMHNRLYELIGTDAYKVNIKTFHSFAAGIMAEYSDYFWNGAELASVPDAMQLDIINQILSTLPLDNPLARRFGGDFTLTTKILDSLKLAKEAGLSPNKLKAMLEANIAYIDLIEPTMVDLLSETLSAKKLVSFANKIIESLPEQNIDQLVAPLSSLKTQIVGSLQNAVNLDLKTSKASLTSKWKQSWVQSVDGQKQMSKERQRNQWWLAVCELYAVYRDRLHANKYYDYADMLVEVISVLEQNPQLLSEVQERYQYVLIDEFQDTNAAQLRLAHLVSDHYLNSGKPNLMVVGDDDQSIYKFNGAELNNMLNFMSYYGIQKPIVLEENYRSSQAILDIAAKVADCAVDRIANRREDVSKNLIAKNPPKTAGAITHKIYSSQEEQYYEVATQIKTEFQKNPNIVVLARSHSSLEEFAKYLHSLNVPIAYERSSNILEDPAVMQVVLMARIILCTSSGDKEGVNLYLSQLLRNPLWGIEPKMLWQMAIDNRFKPDWLNSLKGSHKTDLGRLHDWLLDMASSVKNHNLIQSLEYILGLKPTNDFTSPVSKYYFSGKDLDYSFMKTLSAVQALRKLTYEFSKNPDSTLKDFVNFVDVNSQNNRTLSDDSVFVNSTKAVELLTVHKAKGLEFNSVYIIDAVEDSWKPKLNNQKPPANLPLQPYGEDSDDFVRLFYVAVTRAKANLYISGYSHDQQGLEILPAFFAQKALQPILINPQSPEQTIKTLLVANSWPELNHKDQKLILKPTVEDYRLSVTALINFLDVTKGGPAYFVERNLLRLPESKSTALAYGSAVHSALDFAQRQTNQNKFDIDEVLLRFEDSLAGQYLDKTEFERYLVQGQKVIWTLFGDFRYRLNPGSKSEQSLESKLEDGTLVVGKLDRLDISTEKITIVDYKTGTNYLTNLDTKNKSLAIKAWKYKTQLVFYGLLSSTSLSYEKIENIEAQIVQVETDDPQHLVKSYSPSKEEILNMKQLVGAVYKKIVNLDFVDTSSYSADFEGIQSFISDLINDEV